MHVERDPHAAPVQLGQEALRVREERRLPAVPRPAAAVLRGHRVHAMPVHVEHRDRERQPLGFEAIHELEVGVGAVAVVAAPPVAERPAREHRRLARDGVERLQRAVVVVRVGEHVDVAPAAVARADPAVVLEHERARVVEHPEARRRHDARLERGSPVDLVERPRRAAEILHRLAVAPDVVVVRDGGEHGHAEPGRRERTAVVDQVQPGGEHLERRAAVDDVERGHGQVAMQREGRRAVLEDAVLGPLEAHETVGQHRDAPGVALHRGVRMGDGRCREAEMRVHEGQRE